MLIHKRQLLRPIPILQIKPQHTIPGQKTAFVVRESPEDRPAFLQRVHYPKSPTSLPQHQVHQEPVSRISSEQWAVRAKKRHNVVNRRECGHQQAVSWPTSSDERERSPEPKRGYDRLSMDQSTADHADLRQLRVAASLKLATSVEHRPRSLFKVYIFYNV